MTPAPSTPDPRTQAPLLALRLLGPTSEQHLAAPERLTLVLAALRRGATLEDAVLARVFADAAHDPWLADEFSRWLLRDLEAASHGLLAEGPRRMMDTRDLVQSVFGDLWAEVADLAFETRAQFRALVLQRLRWKAATWSRALTAQKRDERRRVDAPPERLAPQAPDSPELEAEGNELARRVLGAMAKLPERDRTALRLHLEGRSTAAIRDRLGVSDTAARKILQRARERVRSLC